MANHTRFLGLDVHADMISVAVAEPGREGEVRSLGSIPNRPESIRKLIKRLGDPARLRACYEAGPCGYVVYWQLAELGVACDVIAPSLIPVKSGDRVKTDRKDAEKLARCLRSGDLTNVWVPDKQTIALRDLLRARAAAKRDQLRAKNRMSKFLLRNGLRPPEGCNKWTGQYMRWLAALRIDTPEQEVVRSDYLHEVEHALERVRRFDRYLEEAVARAEPLSREVIRGLQALRGFSVVGAATMVAEIGVFSRFERARQAMSYTGLCASEYSTGGPENARRGRITKTGSSHLRHVIVEAAWAYQHRPAVGERHKKRLEGVCPHVQEIAWKAQHRLHSRYYRLLNRGKKQHVAVVAISRELVGFLWAIGRHIEEAHARSGTVVSCTAESAVQETAGLQERQRAAKPKSASAATRVYALRR